MNRRKFLKTIGIGLFGLAIPGSFVPTTASMTSTSNSNNLSTEARTYSYTTPWISTTTTTQSFPQEVEAFFKKNGIQYLELKDDFWLL